MGEVWKARDTRLNRDVAIKISSQQFTDRFEREARAIAALNHLNICTLFDVGPNYLVMELIEGPTLGDRIAEGPIPLEEALVIARQIADALEAAHEKNIVHRDLKPGNIKLRPDGSVKVLDFGLAKSGGEDQQASTLNSPTIMHLPTQAGVILGTAAYMAPEQARGKAVDKRADIWSFGVVLYEMVTGKRPFEGEDLTDTLASVVKSDPDLTVPPFELQRLLKKCLQKDPKKRLRDIGDAWEFLDTTRNESTLSAPIAATPRRPIGWIAASVATLALAGLAFLHFREKPEPHVVARFQYQLPEGQIFTRTGRHDVAISPDGSKLAYVANQQLYLRAMNQLEAQPVRGTNEDPLEPVFSPDGQWLAYFVPSAGGGAGSAPSAVALKKVAITGGAPVTLGPVTGPPFGASWFDGKIAFGVNTTSFAGIQAIPDSGGTPQTLATVDVLKERAAHPQLLADGKHLLFVAVPIVNPAGEGQIVVQGIDGKDRRTLVNGGSDPRALPSGHLAYIHDGTLLAVPFDASRLAVTGGPVPIVEGVTEQQGTWTGQFAVSAEGTFAFVPGRATSSAPPAVMVWLDREGHEQTIPSGTRSYYYPRLSPDGTKIAVAAMDEENDIWVFDLAKNTLTRVTFGPAYETSSVWTMDGRSVVFRSGPTTQAGDPTDLYRKAVDGTGVLEPLTQHQGGGSARSLSPDGKSLLFMKPSPSGTLGMFILPLDPKGPPRPLLAEFKFNVLDAEVSPDGRWIAYDSNESGRYEVYVRPFPAVESGRWQVSSDGGRDPMWARSGRELFFRNAASRMITVPIAAGASFASGKAENLFDLTPYISPSATGRMWDISPDGKRFLAVKPISGQAAPPHPSIVVVSHWFDELKARMPVQK
jgi:serine/threonine-protein kinase